MIDPITDTNNRVPKRPVIKRRCIECAHFINVLTSNDIDRDTGERCMCALGSNFMNADICDVFKEVHIKITTTKRGSKQ